MFAIPVIKPPCPIAVLLGGSGRVQPSQYMPPLPALLKPLPTLSERTGSASEPCAVGV